jgi:hypothetical protein
MEALRLIAEPVNQQLVINLPPSMASRRLEVIVLPANEQNAMPEVVMRSTPSPKLAGTVILHDDLITPACPEEDWDVLR